MSNVKLISHSISCNLEQPQIKTLKDMVSYCARVSNPSNQQNVESADKLIKYLIKNKHWSPFEMVNACVEIETTRDIARQMLRHKSFSFQEFSQRYADPVKELDFVIREARLQDNLNRQNSIETNDEQLQREWSIKQAVIIQEATIAYKWAIANGIAKEQARVVLPEGNTVSRLYMNGTIRSWIHYVELRSAPGTQKEHREIAILCAREISRVFDLINLAVDNSMIDDVKYNL